LILEIESIHIEYDDPHDSLAGLFRKKFAPEVQRLFPAGFFAEFDDKIYLSSTSLSDFPDEATIKLRDGIF
jgi:hypothetical protein